MHIERVDRLFKKVLKIFAEVFYAGTGQTFAKIPINPTNIVLYKKKCSKISFCPQRKLFVVNIKNGDLDPNFKTIYRFR